MKYVKLYVSLLHGPELSCECSLVFLPKKLGNTDRIAGQNLPNITLLMDKTILYINSVDCPIIWLKF